MTDVSVIVPVYNTPEKYLRECIDSLLAQTKPLREIILVDDASTDKSPLILDDYGDRYPDCVRVIHSPINQRQGGARNIGIKAAKSTYIAFMDSDDAAKPDMYEKMYKKAADENADIILCRWERFSDNGEYLGTSVIPEIWHNREINEKTAGRYFLNPQTICCKLFRASIIRENGLYFPTGMFYEDNAFGPLCMLYMKRASYIDEIFYRYRLNAGSTTEVKDANKYFDRCKSALWLDKELKERNIYSLIPDEADFWFFHCYYASCARMCIDGFGAADKKKLREIRNVTRARLPRYNKNPYFISNARNYEREDVFFMRLIMFSPLIGAFAVKTMDGLRRIKGKLRKDK